MPSAARGQQISCVCVASAIQRHPSGEDPPANAQSLYEKMVAQRLPKSAAVLPAFSKRCTRWVASDRSARGDRYVPGNETARLN